MGPIMGGRAVQKYSAAGVNIVFDGNSLVAGNVMPIPATQNIAAQMRLLDPLNGLVNVTNIGVGGQTIADMRGRGAAYADAAFVAGKRNILFAWEGTNSIFNTGVAGAAAATQMAAYCAERLAAHPEWAIILLTTIPRFNSGSFGVAGGNAELSAYDTAIKSNFRAMGAKAVVDVRAAGVFVYTGTTVDPGMAPYMLEDIHYNQAGGAALASYCAATLRRLSSR